MSSAVSIHQRLTKEQRRELRRLKLRELQKLYEGTEFTYFHSRYEGMNKGGITLAWKPDSNRKFIRVGVAICHQDDVFSRREGRAMAFKSLKTAERVCDETSVLRRTFIDARFFRVRLRNILDNTGLFRDQDIVQSMNTDMFHNQAVTRTIREYVLSTLRSPSYFRRLDRTAGLASSLKHALLACGYSAFDDVPF